MRASTDAYGQTTVMVTHEARAAAIADRILFIADGQIVRELGKHAEPTAVLEVMNSLST
jgi:putative ABC transport system ATP-binding protein